jgi:hypothetical protein
MTEYEVKKEIGENNWDKYGQKEKLINENKNNILPTAENQDADKRQI